MNLPTILSDPSLKGVKRRQAVVDLIVAGGCTFSDIQSLLPTLDERHAATILEAIEEITNKRLATLPADYMALAIGHIASPSNSCKREASRIVGNLAGQYPSLLDAAIPYLMDNTRHPGTVVRWSAAYALSRILVLPEYATGALYDDLAAIESHEEENGVKSQYTKALKKAAKLRKG